MQFISTRGDGAKKSFTEVLLSGMAPDGGLYVPTKWPQIDVAGLAGLPYTEVAFKVMQPFVAGEIPDEDLRGIIVEVYENNFGHAAVAPLVQLGPSTWVMELFHGPTLAFKDYALQILGRLFDYVLEKCGENVTIVGATSGDTGSAAIEACKNCKHIDIFILHPKGRTSEVQRRQMTTVNSPNVHNIALEGHFDDCQNAVKAMFADQVFREEMNLSAVNSINWARIMAQIVYYMAAGAALGADKRGIVFAVPTGNFGNVYAAYCAKQMGLNIKQLVIGSNRNDILTRFFETGAMTASTVEPSLSPSMDIQVSSNFERFLFDLLDRKSDDLRAKMDAFKQSGEFTLTDKQMKEARKTFSAYRCSDEKTLSIMQNCYRDTGYLVDPHTAVGLSAAIENGHDPSIPLVALACAHPAKFPDAVEKATGIKPPLPSHLSDLYERKEILTVLPNDLLKLQTHIKENVKNEH
ncbi:MAG: threonine synthase [Micavibrio aeruginosavorus]|uniref:Threonine synthase n=1 Tax=Micavibrio aeruginosavorus TaxID=349221 RepID=A0A2W5MZ74_9BACT|nr:MAG: threonine synthase [Micavibrio aeruginosavorus]